MAWRHRPVIVGCIRVIVRRDSIVFKDFEEGMAYAKEVNKPVMIDFTGHACVNCRKMEEQVWPKKNVYKYLRDDYVLISLYVDEKIDLPEEEHKVVTLKKRG